MSEDKIRQAIKDKSLICPECKKPLKDYDKYVLMTTNVWDGAGDASFGTGNDKVTLICGNEKCSWKERTEYWQNFLDGN